MFDDVSAFVRPHPAPPTDDPDPGFPSPLHDTGALLAAAGLSSRAIREVLGPPAGV